MRAAILSVGTHVFFQLSSADAAQIAQALDGGKPLAERLKNLPQPPLDCEERRQTGGQKSGPDGARSTGRLHRPLEPLPCIRGDVCGPIIERDIAKRQDGIPRRADEVLHDWE